jgi:peptide/nickel transport system substrate-binding protein
MQFRLLGPLEVRDGGGGVVPIAGYQARTLLCVLLLDADRVVSTERLIDALWGDSPPPAAAHGLHVQVSKLRAALRNGAGAGVQISTEAGGYRLQLDGRELDVARVEQLVAQGRRELASDRAAAAVSALRAAESLWRGAPLADFANAAFAQPAITRLEELHRTVVESRIEAQLAAGEAVAVVPELGELAAADPLREQLRGLQMRALYQVGQQARALEVYRETRELLAEELGVDPSPQLQQLTQDILAHDPALRAVPAVASGVAHPHAVVAPEATLAGRPLTQPTSDRAAGRARRHPGRRWVLVAGVLVLAGGAITGIGMVHDGGHDRLALAENSLGVVDPATGQVIGQVGIEVGPTAVAAGFGSIWTANTDNDSVSRVDPTTLQVRDEIPVGAAPSAIATVSGSVWVTESGSGTVARIDPTTDQVRTIRVGVAPSGVVVAHGWVWVTNAADGTVSRIDPSRNREVQRIGVDSGPSGIAAGRDIWVANSASNTVTKIGARHPTLTQRIHVGDDPRGVAVVNDTVWVSNNGSDTITRIAASDGSVAGVVPVGGHPDQIVAAGGHVWATRQGSGALVEIDPADAGVLRTVPSGPSPDGIAVAGGKLWVTTTTDPSAHRGGTLHLVGQVNAVDPVYAPNVSGLNAISLLAGSYDGLVAFRHASGADGLTIVPDLATAIPEPSDGGRTYTFQLRRGIRFSTGRRVSVTDVRRGIERVAAASGDGLQTLLVGARSCRPSHCDISGIGVDAAARTVTIKLVRPSGNLLDLLANGAFAAPPGTPLGETNRPVPATGPYQVTHFTPHKSIVLTRNTYFHEWSASAQPSGFPDRIDYHIVATRHSQDAIDEVAAGHADWADALEPGTGVDTDALDGLQTRFGSRLHLTPTQIMYGLFLNTRIPPFDQPKLRKALAYAIDRKAVIDDWFAPGAIACQFSPPDYPGYRPYCPYTTQSDAGLWQGPDIPKALELIKGLHPGRAPITVWAPPYAEAGIQHVVAALNDLHFRALMRSWPDGSDDYFGYVLDSRNRVQAGFMGWLTYDASAANTFSVYRCNTFVPASPDNYNPAQFCDPSLDRLMQHAEVIQATSLARADDLWATVDRRLVDAAPWIPLVNPFSVDVLSEQVHNFKRTPALGVLFDQMWVR